MSLTLFELAGAEDNRRFSPYCWRIRMALAHKGLNAHTKAWRFNEKKLLEPSGQGKVPVLVHNDTWIADSWAIAVYLENTFPDTPSLFGGPAGMALSKFHAAYGDTISGNVVRFVLLDIYEHLHPDDKAYFRQSREERFGMTLEQVVADRDAQLPAFKASLQPLRTVLKNQPYLGGESPLYADYAIFGVFQWARTISDYTLLDHDDPISLWRARLLEAFNGMAGSSLGYPVPGCRA